MLRVNGKLGNIHENVGLLADVSSWKESELLEEVHIEERDTHKTRLRLLTDSGRDLGMHVPRNSTIADGDLFALWNAEGGLLIHVALQELMVLSTRSAQSLETRQQWLVKLGHVLGNQHWPIAFSGASVLVPVTLDRSVMETVLRTHHLLDRFSTRYERREWPREGDPLWKKNHS